MIFTFVTMFHELSETVSNWGGLKYFRKKMLNVFFVFFIVIKV